MGNQVRAHAAVGEIHQVESRRSRGKGEVSDADKVSVNDAVLMALQRISRPTQQIWRDLAADSFCLPKRRPRSRGRRSQASQREFDKRTARIYQDLEFQHG